MIQQILIAAGGLGLFLLGMTVLTEGLRALAGRSLRRWLTRFTKTPVSGAITGAAVTALIQSSSATTVTAVGFVGAGLLTFPQALGIIYGANVGTTLTGWIVALVGFKLDLGSTALPLLLLGMLMRLFGGARLRHTGWALTGFSLLFIGIDAMQDGLGVLEGAVTPEDFPGDSVWGRLQLVAIGVAITLVTQSSSAGIATALVALGSGAISFPQAAAMVIGMDVGTTFTAFLATLGGTTAGRRTGYAHVIYNVLTGCMAFALLDLYVDTVSPLLGAGSQGDPQVAVVAFHSTFNLLGVILVLPFAGAFARLIEWLVPERESNLVAGLDSMLLQDPDSATDAVAKAVSEAGRRSFRLLRFWIGRPESSQEPIDDPAQELEEMARGLDAIRAYIVQITFEEHDWDGRARLAHLLHALDHQSRLCSRLSDPPEPQVLDENPRLCRCASLLAAALPGSLWPDSTHAQRSQKVADILTRHRHAFRRQALAAATREPSSINTVPAKLDAYRWLERCARHVQRLTDHRSRAAEEVVSEASVLGPGSKPSTGA